MQGKKIELIVWDLKLVPFAINCNMFTISGDLRRKGVGDDMIRRRRKWRMITKKDKRIE